MIRDKESDIGDAEGRERPDRDGEKEREKERDRERGQWWRRLERYTKRNKFRNR